MKEINHLSVHQWLRSAIPESQQPTSPIGFLFLKLPPPPCAVLLVSHSLVWFLIPIVIIVWLNLNHVIIQIHSAVISLLLMVIALPFPLVIKLALEYYHNEDP